MIKMMLLVLMGCCFLAAHVSSSQDAATLSVNNFKRLFDSARPYQDLSAAFYSVKGLELLGEKVKADQNKELCDLVKSKVDKASIESVYYANSLASLLTNCQLTASDFTATLTAASSSVKLPEIFFYVSAAQLLKSPVDSKRVSQSILSGLKADSSVVNQGYALHIASLLGEADKKFFDNIDDLLEQADETDKIYLHYEGGVGTTSLILEGIFALSDKFKQFPQKLDQARLVKFVNYLISKRHPTNTKSAYYFLRVAQKLSDNQFAVPVVLSRISSINLSPSAQTSVVVSLTNIFGSPLKKKLALDADSAKAQKSSNTFSLVPKKKAFTSKSSDGTSFELGLIDASQAKSVQADFYSIQLSLNEPEKRFFLLQSKVEVKITTQIDIANLQIGVADKDQSSPKLTKVQDNKKIKDTLEADLQSKFYLRFNVQDKVKSQSIEAHQAMVKFTSVATGKEIFFLAQLSNNQYNADVDIATNAKNFRHQSGVYSVELIVSDSLIENPQVIPLADLKIRFSDESLASTLSSQQNIYAMKPEIKHLFREPEVTPPKTVSSVFAILCILPLGLLFVLWISIGFNFSKFSFSLSSIIFHLSLAAIFGLFYCYWIKLNMFVTLKYLAALGVVAFLSGNQTLRNLAAKKQKN